MFQAVINQTGWSAGRFGAGVWVSLAVHAAVFGGILGASGREAREVVKEPEVHVYRQLPPRGNPTPPSPVAQPQTPPKPKPPKRELRQPRKIPALPPEPPTPVEAPPEPVEASAPVDPSLPYIPGSDPNGVDSGGTIGAAPPLPDEVLGNGGGTGEEVLPFGSGMTPPQLLDAGIPLRYTTEALHARVSGTLIARCTVTREGAVEDCRVIKGLPFMDAAVVEGLTSRRYRPVTFQGRPVTVKYTFNVSLKLP